MQRCEVKACPKPLNIFFTVYSNAKKLTKDFVLNVNAKKLFSAYFVVFTKISLFKCGFLCIGLLCGHPEATMTAEIRMHPIDEICLMCAKINEGPSTPLFESPDLMNLFITVIGFQVCSGTCGKHYVGIIQKMRWWDLGEIYGESYRW